MRRPWSGDELEETVADYFAMLREQLAGSTANKTAHRERLMARLDARSAQAVEFKHANISAVLVRLGCPIQLRGYLPRFNFQRELLEAVAGYLARDPALNDTIEFTVRSPVPDPDTAGILAAMVEAPPKRCFPPPAATGIPERRPGSVRDFFELEARNGDLGRKGEEFVLEYERARFTCIAPTISPRGGRGCSTGGAASGSILRLSRRSTWPGFRHIRHSDGSVRRRLRPRCSLAWRRGALHPQRACGLL